ncbi:hypothetical protein MUK42_23969, partial [Musa troglodytarum]
SICYKRPSPAQLVKLYIVFKLQNLVLRGVQKHRTRKNNDDNINGKVGDIEGELGVPVGFLDDPHRSIIPALSEAQLSEPRLDAREAVGVERLLLVGELLEPLLILRRRRERRRGRRGRNQRSPPAPPPPDPPQGRWGLEARGKERGKTAGAGEEGGFGSGKGIRVHDG